MNTKIRQNNTEKVYDGLKFDSNKLNMRIGKSLTGKDALPRMKIKEVRLWNTFRDIDLISKYRQKIINPINDFYGKDLLIYLPMNEDNNKIHNHVALVNSQAENLAEINEFSHQSSVTEEIHPVSGEVL